jgi:hypothetical protein
MLYRAIGLILDSIQNKPNSSVQGIYDPHKSRTITGSKIRIIICHYSPLQTSAFLWRHSSTVSYSLALDGHGWLDTCPNHCTLENNAWYPFRRRLWRKEQSLAHVRNQTPVPQVVQLS